MPAYGLIGDSIGGYYVGKALRKSTRSRRSGRSTRQATGVAFRTTNITMTLSYKDIKFYEWALNLELHTPAGGLWKDLERRSTMAMYGAKAQVGVRTGALRKSLYKTHTADSRGQTVIMGSNLSYALLHHNGSKPHFIAPKDEGGVLVFRSGSKIIRSQRVLHPGTRPNPYLSRQLRHFKY
jgi:hypothetical protein